MNMRSILTTVIVVFAAVFSSRAQSIEGVTTNFSTFNAALIVITNKPVLPSTYTNLFINSVGKAKLTNKQLLPLFASWMSVSNWPAGARLIFDWQSYQVCVADASGTNILMYCLDDFKTGFDGITTNITIHTFTHGKKAGLSVTNITYVTNFTDGKFLQVDWFHAPGASAVSLNTANPGSEKLLGSDGSYFRLHDNVGNTGVTCYGGNLQKFSQTWDVNGLGLIWKDSESSRFSYYGNQTVLGLVNATIGGTMTASGAGKGYNPVIQ